MALIKKVLKGYFDIKRNLVTRIIKLFSVMQGVAQRLSVLSTGYVFNPYLPS